ITIVRIAHSALGIYVKSLTHETYAIPTRRPTDLAGQKKVYGENDEAPVAGFAFGTTGLVNGVTPKYWNSSGNYVNDTTINDTISGNLQPAAGEDVGNYNYNIGSVAVSAPGNYVRS